MVKILFIVDYKKDSGLGHFMRCRSLAAALADKKIKSAFFLNADLKGNFPPRGVSAVLLKNLSEHDSLKKIAQYRSSHSVDLVIVDSYLYSHKFYEKLKGVLSTPVIAIDDNGEKSGFPVSGYINFNLYANKSFYPKESWNRSAIGAGFYPLRSEIRAGKKRKEKGRSKKLLITMGGSDPEDQTLRLVELVKSWEGPEQIIVILGPAYGDDRPLKKLISADSRFKVYRDPKHLASLFNQVDLAVTGGGSTCYELSYLGVPMAVITLSNNQVSVAASIEKQGCGISLGWFDRISNEKLLSTISCIFQDHRKLRAFSAKAKRMIDGQGARRLANFLIARLNDNEQDIFSLQEVQQEYETAARRKKEYAKLKWGSQAGMTNRFHLAAKTVNWQKVKSWLDVGSGTGAFLSIIEKSVRIQRFVGIDLSPSLVKFSRKKHYRTNRAVFINKNLIDFDSSAKFDLVTAVGVLQKCAVSLPQAVAKLASLVKKGGQVFITTKNRDWKMFSEPGFVQCPDHHWFRMSELKAAFAGVGLKIKQFKGFNPRIKNSICGRNDSHSIYILAEKER